MSDRISTTRQNEVEAYFGKTCEVTESGRLVIWSDYAEAYVLVDATTEEFECFDTFMGDYDGTDPIAY